jgi:uncharacterized glyoxalase superfamily protein PhnB
MDHSATKRPIGKYAFQRNVFAREARVFLNTFPLPIPGGRRGVIGSCARPCHDPHMMLACSHVILASANVPRITEFFGQVFGMAPRFANDMFAEFVLPSRFRVAFFKPVGASARTFHAAADRAGCALGITVVDVEDVYRSLERMKAPGVQLSGPPKDHPWGEKSFLLTDPDGNRWEITQTPSPDGMLTNR